ncbi:MAG: META domain-containing protein [Bacteroidota bacterium]|nr:META domain-containing protein [Bacteroidota bacterium]
MKKILFACFLFWTACQYPAGRGTDPVAVAASSPPASGPVAQAIQTKDTTTLNGLWYLQPVLASDTATGQIPELRFDLAKSRFTGNTGCNKMSGEFWYSAHDSSLSFSDKFASTKMACPGYNEQGFINSLKNVNHFRLRNGVLILLNDATELSHWVRREKPAPRTGRA